MSAKYGRITFASDYNRSFAEFKEDFADSYVFNDIPTDKREAEYKKAYKIATAHLQKDGNIQTTVSKGEKDKREKID